MLPDCTAHQTSLTLKHVSWMKQWIAFSTIYSISFEAMKMKDLGVIRCLVDNGFDVNDKDEEGKSCLQRADAIPDRIERLIVLRALHRQPPDSRYMSEGKSVIG